MISQVKQRLVLKYQILGPEIQQLAVQLEILPPVLNSQIQRPMQYRPR